MTKRAKQQKGRKQNEAWEDFLVQAAILLIKAVVLVALPLVGLWLLLGGLQAPGLRIMAAGGLYCIIPAFIAGVEYGRTQGEGVIEGIDTAITKLSKAVDLRDGSLQRNTTTRRRQNPTPVDYNVYLPNHEEVPFTYKSLTDGQSEVIDL